MFIFEGGIKVELPYVIKDSLEVETEVEKKTRKKKVKFTDSVEEWSLHTFAKYFEYLYQHKFKKPYIPVKGDLKQLKRVLEVKDRETVKQYIEIFMEIDFFKVKTIRAFCSNYSQAVLDNYVTSGDLPNYTKNKIHNEPTHLNDWANEIDNIFGGGKE